MCVSVCLCVCLRRAAHCSPSPLHQVSMHCVHTSPPLAPGGPTRELCVLCRHTACTQGRGGRLQLVARHPINRALPQGACLGASCTLGLVGCRPPGLQQCTMGQGVWGGDRDALPSLQALQEWSLALWPKHARRPVAAHWRCRPPGSDSSGAACPGSMRPQLGRLCGQAGQLGRPPPGCSCPCVGPPRGGPQQSTLAEAQGCGLLGGSF